VVGEREIERLEADGGNMGITTGQRERRKKYLGGSDAGAILGVDPWNSAFNVWAERCLELDPSPEPIAGTGAPAELGELFEDAGIKFATRAVEAHPGFTWSVSQEETRAPSQNYIRNQWRVGANGVMAGHLDAILEGTVNGLRTGVEAKATSLIGDWGEPWTDQIPEQVEAQCHHNLYAGNLEMMLVPCFTPSYGRLRGDVYVVNRDEEMIKMLEAEELAFWALVKSGKPPDDWMPSAKIVNRMVRRAKTWKPVPLSVVELWRESKRELNNAQVKADAIKNTLKFLMGDCDGGDLGFGAETELTLFKQTRDSFGIGPEYAGERCKECQVGRKTAAFRVLRERKVTSRGETKTSKKRGNDTAIVAR